MATKKAAPVTQEITIPALNLREVEIELVGDSPLISHAWSEKAKGMMLAKQMKRATAAKEAKDPFVDFVDSLYWLTEKPTNAKLEDVKGAKFGMPAVSFKAAAVDACSHVDGLTKVVARGAFHIIGEMVEIISEPPTMREDMVRISMGVADIRFRGEFKTWRVKIHVRYNASVISPEQIVNLFNTAGFAMGIGEWRPQKNGSYGMFHVATSADDKEVSTNGKEEA